ncbi:hypothetical protein L1S35_04895 [Flavobacterium sp. AS60]|uniref:hypothetical protein n=1 Tax=Flavobacterium anseongense TaxID=2910677 RepID=UPI001F33E3CA|nr:hypothetical protein [Flavobacterium sp. AS60]MCF6129000.1 hypothetical protein [Flavobacterium sp. AS60]
MKTHFLFPNKFKKLGWLLFVPSFIASLIISIADLTIDNYWIVNVFSFTDGDILGENNCFIVIKNSIVDEVLLFSLIIGGLLIGFSKLKIEDEFTSKIRYESLVWATYLNYGLILFFTIFVYGLSYLNILFFNTFTLLLFFIIRFHYLIYKLNKTSNDDE